MSEDLDRIIRNIRYRIRKKDPSGFEDAVRLAEQYPEDADVWDTVSYAYDKRDDHAAAMAAMTRAIELDPKGLSLFYKRGEYALRTGDHESAVADFSRGLVLSDELNKNYLRDELHFRRAEAFIQLGKKAEALADLSQLRDDYVNFGPKIRTKADLLVMCGESLPPPKEQEDEPPVSSPAIADAPDEEEVALAEQLGEAGIAAVDAALLEQLSHRYLKAARIIGDAIDFGSYPADSLHVRLFARRLIALAEAGAIVARGNLLNPRRSVVRLPDSP
ncbi:tetratricopeptide repeat protein [Polyangium spumosum]|uniref:Uncharacterized protein n=1 Tax=Polyangium spumosum TaxID=889282 RepID=A0A6N7PJ82_9BACT|nr:tetratricopeptide repeat protein [Polyangium spumosum]MRG90886.1 hypothetical protein [Polyangium spumosum]